MYDCSAYNSSVPNSESHIYDYIETTRCIRSETGKNNKRNEAIPLQKCDAYKTPDPSLRNQSMKQQAGKNETSSTTSARTIPVPRVPDEYSSLSPVLDQSKELEHVNEWVPTKSVKEHVYDEVK